MFPATQTFSLNIIQSTHIHYFNLQINTLLYLVPDRMEKIQTVNYKHTITQYYHKAIISWAAPLYFMTRVLDGAGGYLTGWRQLSCQEIEHYIIYQVLLLSLTPREREYVSKALQRAPARCMRVSSLNYSLDSPDSSDSSDSRTYLSPVHPFFIHLCSSYLNKACTSQSYLIESRIIKSHLYGDVLL